MWSFIKQQFSHYKNLETVPFEKLPAMNLVSEDLVLNKDRSFTLVIKVEGIDYNGISDLKYISLKKARESAIRKAGEVVLTSTTMRFRQNPVIRFPEVTDPVSNEILKRWGGSFRDCYINNHYIAITSKPGSDKKQWTRLRDIGAFIVQTLDEFSPKIIKNEELIAYYCSLMNANHYEKVGGINDVFENYLSATPIELWERSNNINYLESGKVSSFVTIKNMPEFLHQEIFDDLLRRNVEMIVTQHSKIFPNEESINWVKTKLHRQERFSSEYNRINIAQLREILELLTANKTSLADHCLSIQVISPNEKSHKTNLNEVEALFSQNNFVISKNILSKESLYWSQFPSKMKSNVRVRRVNSGNVTEGISFSASGIGNTRCSWGDHPVDSFTTIDGNIFNFIFHADESEDANGQTLIMGRPGTGKTTLISKLLTGCMTYENMKILAFDRLHGMEVATLMQNGTYIDFSDPRFGINPLIWENNPDNKLFLIDFFESMLDPTPKEKLQIEENAAEILDWDDTSISIDEIPYLFGNDADTIIKKLKQWTSSGAYGSYFTAKKNYFDLENTLTTFDATVVLENPKILGLIASYLTHSFFSQMTEKDRYPRAIFVDELKNYLDAPTFRKLLSRIINEIRKRNGIFIGAVQDIDQIWSRIGAGTGDGDISLSNFATFILFPVDGIADEEPYIKGLTLTDDELYWLANTDTASRQVMIKKNGGKSTIINIDLSYLDEYLWVYNSSSRNILLLKDLMKKYPETFRDEYLKIKRNALFN